jgi:hypothetical protein
MTRWQIVLSCIGGGLAALATLGGAVTFWNDLIGWLTEVSGISLAETPHGNLVKFGLLVVVVLVLAGVIALLQFLAKALTSPEPAQPSIDKSSHSQVRQKYLEYMKREISGRLKASIHHAVIELHQEELFGAANPWFFVPQPGYSAPRSFSSFDAAYQHYNRRLLLLGHPGSGESTTLLLFAQKLVEKALADPECPVPLLENLSQFQDFRIREGTGVLGHLDRQRQRDPKEDLWIPKPIGQSHWRLTCIQRPIRGKPRTAISGGWRSL